MSRKRSSYRPRHLLASPWAITTPAPKSKTARVMLRFLTALDAMARGEHPGEQEWRDLSDAVNTVETLAIVLRKLQTTDALRLAVQLRIDLHTSPLIGEAVIVTAKRRMRSDLWRQPNPTMASEECAADPYAATRRAIVRAAAEIGRAMP